MKKIAASIGAMLLLLSLTCLIGCGEKAEEQPEPAVTDQPTDDPILNAAPTEDEVAPAANPAGEGDSETDALREPPSVESATGGNTGTEGEGTGG